MSPTNTLKNKRYNPEVGGMALSLKNLLDKMSQEDFNKSWNDVKLLGLNGPTLASYTRRLKIKSWSKIIKLKINRRLFRRKTNRNLTIRTI